MEAITAAEAAGLGIAVREHEPGGLGVRADLRELYRLNLHLATASRVLVRVAEFHAAAFGELERRAGEVDWPTLVPPGSEVSFRVTCRKSRLYHTGAVAERLQRSLAGAVAGVRFTDGTGGDDDGTEDGGGGEADHGAEDGGGDERAGPALRQQFVVRLFRDTLTLSADASGEHLHRRGYREATARAPLRETLAAAVLTASGWTPDAALVDPLCGSGTFPIEAARRARGIPSGWDRRFAFEAWADFDPKLWAAVRAEAERSIAPAAAAPILASDRDAGAVAAARENAERAGVGDDIVFDRLALSAAAPPAGWQARGSIVTNPPWGRRIGRADRLRDLYAALGRLHREAFPDWDLAVLTADPALAGQVGPGSETPLLARNGNVPVRLYRWGAATRPSPHR